MPSPEFMVLTFVNFESMEVRLSDDIHPVHYYIDPDCPTRSTFTSRRDYQVHTVDKRREIGAVVRI